MPNLFNCIFYMPGGRPSIQVSRLECGTPIANTGPATEVLKKQTCSTSSQAVMGDFAAVHLRKRSSLPSKSEASA